MRERGRENTLVDSMANCVPRPLLPLSPAWSPHRTDFLPGMSPCGREARKNSQNYAPRNFKRIKMGLVVVAEDLTTVTGDTSWKFI